MKSKFFFATIAALVAAFTMQPQRANATIWRVNNNPVYIAGTTPGTLCDHCFDNLQDAINDVNVGLGDTLHVEASPTPYEGITINNNKRLILLGPGYFLNDNPGLQHNLIPATIKFITLELGAKGTILKGLSVGETGISYITIKDEDITIERCYSQNGIYFQNPNAINNITIKQNYIAGTVDYPGVPKPVNNLVITNNYFGGQVRLATNHQGIAAQNVFNNGVNGYGGMVYYNNIIKGGNFTQNTNSVTNVYKNIFHNTPAWLDVPNPNNYFNVVMTSVFATTGSADGRFDPLPACTNCPNGQNGHEIGMFGGPDAYRLSGVPDIPTVVDLKKDANVVQGGALPITVKTRANN